MLSREVLHRSHRRALVRLAVFSLLAGALVGPMFLFGARTATAPVREVVIVHRQAPPPATVATTACAPAAVRSTVSRSAADAWLTDSASFVKSARVVPALIDGQPHGFKLYAIQPGTALAAVGFNNGDTVTRIDGVDVTSFERVVEVLARWRNGAPTAVIDLMRRGCPVALTVTLV